DQRHRDNGAGRLARRTDRRAGDPSARPPPGNVRGAGVLLSDRVAFVTGAGSGIGRAGALALARAGATVVVTDLVAERAASVAAEIFAVGGWAEDLCLDVTDDAALS